MNNEIHTCSHQVLHLPTVASKQLEVDLKDSLEKTHVGSVVQTDLVFPQVHNQNLRSRNREQCTFALEVLQTRIIIKNH